MRPLGKTRAINDLSHSRVVRSSIVGNRLVYTHGVRAGLRALNNNGSYNNDIANKIVQNTYAYQMCPFGCALTNGILRSSYGFHFALNWPHYID